MLNLEDIREILAIDLIGLIPESEAVLRASNQGIPVTHDANSGCRSGLYRHGLAAAR